MTLHIRLTYLLARSLKNESLAVAVQSQEMISERVCEKFIEPPSFFLFLIKKVFSLCFSHMLLNLLLNLLLLKMCHIVRSVIKIMFQR
jgi:hypothetical protein